MSLLGGQFMFKHNRIQDLEADELRLYTVAELQTDRMLSPVGAIPILVLRFPYHLVLHVEEVQRPPFTLRI